MQPTSAIDQKTFLSPLQPPLAYRLSLLPVRPAGPSTLAHPRSDVFTLTCFLVLTARSCCETIAAAAPAATAPAAGPLGAASAKPITVGAGSGSDAALPAPAGSDRWRHFLLTLVPPAVSCLPSAIASLSRVVLSRAAWLRLQCALRLPRLLMFCVAGSLIAWFRFPAACAIRSYQLSACAFVGDGAVHIMSSLVSLLSLVTVVRGRGVPRRRVVGRSSLRPHAMRPWSSGTHRA